ncbi:MULTISPECIES: glycosyltransferase family 2 protein [unclassified Shewanella]|uniref:glycosyltransferase family 2 protein n=1 Tax=unclassified Shewanella TaxID=196818 RepID=UPI002006A5AB|nr:MULTISPECIES: glycosyltransferase family A protein [unclassified Shewanella]MCK7634365.1 glycosyltransferase family 2 protein [Shewanella sp. JNE17]MCK7649635.1 glycosyltransferase family 2 protein [Shewanella sp. JNE8]MCK7657794.1 glycosyltransferase family 2 protein [Shewanella sp. JNE4-2]UPO30008.1 glycosyltransferase family 2 protein [Shewanella sp. JNE2]
MHLDKKVSIITPCFNGEKFIHRLLDSVLMQDYPCIEMCVIDDGSVDNSAQIIKSYIPRFSAKGYQLTYLYQDNSGQSVAINKGLQWMAGDYLAWPDSDDFYAVESAITQLVQVLEASDEQTSMVRCHCTLLDEETLKQVGLFAVNKHNDDKTDLFEDCLFAQNGFWFVPGNYMAKVAHLREVLPSLTIYTEKNAGQNWQLMLPLLYNRKCITIKHNLYSVLVRANSHSRGQYSTYEQVVAKYQAYERTILNVLDGMKLTQAERQPYIDNIKQKYKVVKLQVMIDFAKSKEARLLFGELTKLNQKVPLKTYVKYQLIKLPSLYRLLKSMIQLARKV